MSHVASEIASQPECWLRAAELASDPGTAALLPRAGERVAVTGCGTSAHIARACARLREDAGFGETDAWESSEFPARRRYDRVMAITRSGSTTEVLRLLERLRGAQPTTVVTTRADLPVVAAADAAVLLDFADEQSVVQTRFATSVLALWRAHLGEDLHAAVADARAELVTPLPQEWIQARNVTFLGTRWTVGLADEAALKLREGAQLWTESYPAMEVRHGPISVLSADSLAWVFGAVPSGLREDLAVSDARIETSDVDPMAHLVLAQRLAVAIAEVRGIDPDAPRNLTRSIILTGS